MNRRQPGRDIHGIVLLDKRQGVSSNRAMQEVKRVYRANKAGHTGALDPLATGLLPVCLGEATKVSSFLLDGDKDYQVTVRLGVMTATGDTEGEVVSTAPVPQLTEAGLRGCLQAFTGAIGQVPPMYSALKRNGVKLYQLARQGKSVERKARTVTIHALELVAFDQQHLRLAVSCSKGTYIRSLAEDIGHALGSCATVAALRRTRAGPFTLADAHPVEALAAMDGRGLLACLLPVDLPLAAIPAVGLSEAEAARIRCGQAIPGQKPGAGPVRLYLDGQFLGLGELSADGKIAPKKLFNINNPLPA